MDKRRLDGLYLVLLGCAVFLMLGIAMGMASPASMLDFKVVYYGARTLVQHQDPYKYGEVLRLYLLDGGKLPFGHVDLRIFRDVMSMCIYLPTALAFMLPLTPAEPAMVVTAPAGVISRIVWLP